MDMGTGRGDPGHQRSRGRYEPRSLDAPLPIAPRHDLSETLAARSRAGGPVQRCATRRVDAVVDAPHPGRRLDGSLDAPPPASVSTAELASRAARIFLRCIAATPRLGREYFVETRRRGWDVDSPRRRVDAAGAARRVRRADEGTLERQVDG